MQHSVVYIVCMCTAVHIKDVYKDLCTIHVDLPCNRQKALLAHVAVCLSVEMQLSVPVMRRQDTVFVDTAFLAKLKLAIWSLIDNMNTSLFLTIATAFIFRRSAWSGLTQPL